MCEVDGEINGEILLEAGVRARKEEVEQKANIKSNNTLKLSQDEKQRCLNVFQEIQNSCLHRDLDEKKRLNIEAHLRGALSLSEDDTCETADHRSDASKFQNILIYRDLMTFLMRYESQQKSWSGEPTAIAKQILSLFAQSKNMSNLERSFACFSAYADAYQPALFDMKEFEDVLDRIIESADESDGKKILACIPVTTKKQKSRKNHLKQVDGEIYEEFWASIKKLFKKFAVELAENIHSDSSNDDIKTVKITTIKSVLRVVVRIEELAANEHQKNINFENTLSEAITTYNHVSQCVSEKVLKEADDDEHRLRTLSSGINHICIRIREIIDEHLEGFACYPAFLFPETLFKIYDDRVEQIVKPIVTEISKTLNKESEATTVIAAYALYEELHEFQKFGVENFGNANFKTENFSEWFPEQLLTSVANTSAQISEAIKKDDSSHEFADYKRTSSACDSMGLIFRVKDFWVQFARSEQRETEVLEFITHEVWRLTFQYIDEYSSKIETQDPENESYYSVPLKMSIAIANFQYVFVEMQGLLGKIMKEHNFSRAMMVMDIFKANFKVIDDKMNTVIESSLRNFMPAFKEWMIEAVECKNSVAEFLKNFEEIIRSFRKNFKSKRCDYAVLRLWTEIVNTLPQIMEASIEKINTQEFFVNLTSVWMDLKSLLGDFPLTDEQIDKIRSFEENLELYSLDSSQLISREYEDQKGSVQFSPSATVSCTFSGNQLKIEVLHAQKLDLVVPERNCHSFIEIRLFYADSFNSTPRLRTKTHHNTHWPLFDETLAFDLTEQQRKLQNALVFFRLKRKHPMGHCINLGEAFLSFNEIPVERPLRKEVMFLKMTDNGRQSMRVLSYRGESNDKETKKFLFKMDRRNSGSTGDLLRRRSMDVMHSIRNSFTKLKAPRLIKEE